MAKFTSRVEKNHNFV